MPSVSDLLPISHISDTYLPNPAISALISTKIICIRIHTSNITMKTRSGNVYQPRTPLHTVQAVRIMNACKNPKYESHEYGVTCTIDLKHGRSKLEFRVYGVINTVRKQQKLRHIKVFYYDLDIQDTRIFCEPFGFILRPISSGEHLYTTIDECMRIHCEKQWNLLSQELGPTVFNQLVRKACNNVWTTIDNLYS